MANLLDEVERMPETPSVPVLVALLRSTDEGERDDALASLAEMVDGAFGEDGEQLGLAVRANGGVALLSWLLADPSPDVQQMSLMIIGNLCSDSVDANSKETKRLLLQSGGARAILSCAFTEDPAVLLFACGALQNLCFEVAWSELAVSHDVHKRLESLLFHEDAMIVRYASVSDSGGRGRTVLVLPPTMRARPPSLLSFSLPASLCSLCRDWHAQKAWPSAPLAAGRAAEHHARARAARGSL